MSLTRFGSISANESIVSRVSLLGTGNTAGNTTVTGGDIYFQGGNNMTISMTNNTVVFSAGGGGGGITNINVSAGTTSNNLSNIVFSNSNNVTFGLNGSTVTGSASFNQTVQPGIQSIQVSDTTYTTGNVIFSNANGLTFGSSAGGAITASHNGITSQTNQQLSLYAVSNTTQSSSGLVNASNLSFQGAGVASVGISNGSVIVSVPAGGGGLTNINVSAGTTSNNLSNLEFSNANGVSFGLNGSTVTASVNAAGGNTREFYNPYGDLPRVAGQVGQATMNINPNDFPNCTFDRVYMPINITNSSNSSGSHTLSFWLGIYTRNVSTLSLLTSQSTSYALTHSGTAGSYSLYSGMRHISMGISTSLSEGIYYLGLISRTTSGGANGSYSQFLASNLNSNFLGHFSSAQNTTMQFRPGLGVYSVTLSSIPSSIGISQIRGSDSNAQRPPLILFANSTI